MPLPLGLRGKSNCAKHTLYGQSPLLNFALTIDRLLSGNNNCNYIINRYIEGKVMGQVTIYLDNNIETKMKEAAKSGHLSVSK